MLTLTFPKRGRGPCSRGDRRCWAARHCWPGLRAPVLSRTRLRTGRMARNGPARDQGGDLPDQFLGMVGRDDDLSLLDQWRALHQHERSGPSLAGIPRFRLPILPLAGRGRDVSRLYPRGGDPDQQHHRPALRRRSRDHGLAARQRAAAGGERGGGDAQPAGLLRLGAGDGAADQVARSQPSRLDRQRGAEGLHRERGLRRHRA